MAGIKRLGHVGLYVNHVPTMKNFYTEVLGLTVSDQDAESGNVFLTADPEYEHHELLLATRSPDQPVSSVQQLSFKCGELQDVVNFYRRFKDRGVRFDRVVSHGNAVGLYFFDPEGNRIEVYWTSPFKAHQPYAVAVDLTRPIDDIMRELEASVKEHGETGFRDPDSFVQQRDQLTREGILVGR